MALGYEIDMAAKGEPSGPGGSQFVDDSLVPGSLAACYPTRVEAQDAARRIYRTARDREEWIFLLAALLGEG